MICQTTKIIPYMSKPSNKVALFIAQSLHLDSPYPGGVQICSREYFEVLESAGFDLLPIKIGIDRRPLTRLKRKLWYHPYYNFFNEAEFKKSLKEIISKKSVEFTFINQRQLAPFSKIIKEVVGSHCRVIILSHGLESVDFFHKMRIESGGFIKNKIYQRMLGQQLLEESRQNLFIDDVFTLAPFEGEIERWLGMKSVLHVPRVVKSEPLSWNPREGRVGFVGTLDHPVNLEGLRMVLEQLKISGVAASFRFRIVGGPENIAGLLEKEFPFVEYAGTLHNPRALEEEVATWHCFVHPLFCYARGCSTKLAVALGWQIPIATTSMGCRGYVWREGQMPIADSPQLLAKLILSMLNRANAQKIRDEIRKIALSSPTIEEVAEKIRAFLCI